MSDIQKRNRIARLQALIEGQPESELKTQFAAAVKEIAKLESELEDEPEPVKKTTRKKTSGRDRMSRSGRDRSE